MSLLQARGWWSHASTEDDEYDTGGLLVTTLGDSSSDKIVTGSLGGLLRVWQPSCQLARPDAPPGTSVHDLLLEKRLPGPILQLAAGRFSA